MKQLFNEQVVYGNNVCVQPWFSILGGWGIYYDGLVSEIQVDRISLPLEIVGRVVDRQERVFIQGITGCIISFSLSGNDIENLDEITNSIDIFITLDIVIVV